MLFNIVLIINICIIYIFINGQQKNDKSSKEKFFLFICFVIMFFLVGFRSYSSGNDTKTYVEVFKICSTLKWNAVNTLLHYDKGYLVFNVLATYFTSNSRIFLLLLSFICNISVYHFVKNNSKNYLVSIILYVSLLFFYSSMTMARQFLSFSIILYSFDFVRKKKVIKFFLLILLASLFHSSAIISLLIYPFYYLKFSHKRAIFMIFISFIIFVFLGRVFNDISSYLNKTTSYIDTLGTVKVANVLYTVVYLIVYVFVVLFLMGRENKKNNSFYLYITLMGFLIYFLSIKISILARAAQYFTIFIIIVIPNIIQDSNNKKEVKSFISIIICVLFILYANTIIYLRPEWNSAFNYSSCIKEKNCTN